MQIDLKQPILQKNDAIASELRERFAENHVFVLDLLASPGSGKTSTILATIDALRDEFNIAVIEGDIASSVDAEKIKAQGIAAVQSQHGWSVPPGKRHDKARGGRAGPRAPRPHHRGKSWATSCAPPTSIWGENAKVMILSVPEGDDKPLKYPGRVPGRRGRGAQQGWTPCPCSTSTARPSRRRLRSSTRQAPIFPIAATKGRRRGRLGRVAGEPHSRRLVPTACQPSERSRRCEAPMRPISPLFRFPSRAKARFP